MKLIDGKLISAQVKEEIALEVQNLKEEGHRAPNLAVIMVGEDGASATYVSSKVKSCQQVGFESTDIHFQQNVSEAELLNKISELNEDDKIDGFIVQLPLPDHISEEKVIESIDHRKDVDGFHPINVGRMSLGLPAFVSATPAGVVELLDRYQIETEGKHVVVLGRSNIVGTPVSILLSRKARPGNATVTLCHSRTKDLPSVCSQADILIVAIGQQKFVTENFVKEGAVVIDVGIHRIKSNKTKSGWKLVGDVDFDAVAPRCSFITPVPGGVGPMTIVSLLKNTLLASQKKIYRT
jgi:methylenetetrahydrofolate dehydrogenase (NADP+) / methenyltetrahydrofolate cyclohydrolase